jgi:hypothetical protein
MPISLRADYLANKFALMFKEKARIYKKKY